MCQICGDEVGTAVDGELFVACDVCSFPVCRLCYEYERKDGKQSCPQCKTRYKRHKGSIPSQFLFCLSFWSMKCVGCYSLDFFLQEALLSRAMERRKVILKMWQVISYVHLEIEARNKRSRKEC